jgi:hypothetical protein
VAVIAAVPQSARASATEPLIAKPPSCAGSKANKKTLVQKPLLHREGKNKSSRRAIASLNIVYPTALLARARQSPFAKHKAMNSKAKGH